MDQNERKSHFSIIDRMIDSSDPLRAEYLRGYLLGIDVQAFGISEGWIEEHRILIGYSLGGSGDSYIDSYARGYRHGFEGKTPESLPLSSDSSKSLADTPKLDSCKLFGYMTPGGRFIP
jgi:hypothetical protein